MFFLLLNMSMLDKLSDSLRLMDYYFHIYIYFGHLYLHYFLLVFSPHLPYFSNIFLIITPSTSYYRHHTNYTIEPPTVSIIFLTLSHERPQVSPVNVSNILVLSIIISTNFFTLLHYKHTLSKTIITISVSFIFVIIVKGTQNISSYLLLAHKYHTIKQKQKITWWWF